MRIEGISEPIIIPSTTGRIHLKDWRGLVIQVNQLVAIRNGTEAMSNRYYGEFAR